MQKRSDIQNISTTDQRKNLVALNCDGYIVAQLFLYYRRLLNPHIKNHLPLKLVSAKKLYSKHKDQFDAFAKNAVKNNFDVDPYIKFCVVECGLNEKTIDLCISSTLMLARYDDHLKLIAKRRKIYKWFMKSAKNIAEYCIESGYFSARDFIKHLIETNKVGPYIMSGKISVYYFAAMPNFGKIISKLDYFSRNELSYFEKHFNVFHNDVNDAFLYVKNMLVNAIDITDKILLKMRQKKI